MTRAQFFEALEDMGYELKLYKKSGDWLEHPALKPPGAKGYFRFHKLGKGYDLQEIERRIWRNMNPREPFPEDERRTVERYRRTDPPPLYETKKPQLYRLYLRYCYELHIIEKHPASAQRVSFFMRDDLIKLDRLDAETRLLAKHGIETSQELSEYRGSVLSTISKLEKNRAILRKTNSAEAKEITKELRELRREVRLCDDIELRSAQTVKELEGILAEQEIETGKDKHNNELLRRRGGASREDDPRGR